MKLKLTRNIRLILALTVGIVLLLFNISMVVNPTIDDIKETKTVYAANDAQIEDLNTLEGQKAEREKKEQFIRYQLELITQKLPNNVVPEMFISEIKRIVLDKGIKVEDVTFTEPKIVKLNGIMPISGDAELLEEANKSIYNLFKDDKYEETKASDRILQYTMIPDDSVIRVNVQFSIKGTYQNIKRFIDYIEIEEKRDGDPQNKIIINSVNLAPSTEENSNDIEGKIELSFYGIKDSKIPVYNLWNNEVEQGKSDFFSTEFSERIDIQGSTISDFDIKLTPVTSDYPSVILAKSGEYSTKIYGENAKNENTVIELQGSDGNYSYRFNTESVNYPLNGGCILLCRRILFLSAPAYIFFLCEEISRTFLALAMK